MNKPVFHIHKAKKRTEGVSSEHYLYLEQFEAILAEAKGNVTFWKHFKEYAEGHEDGTYWDNEEPEAKFSSKLKEIINAHAPEGDGCYGNAFFYDVIAGFLKDMEIQNVWKIGNKND